MVSAMESQPPAGGCPVLDQVGATDDAPLPKSACRPAATGCMPPILRAPVSEASVERPSDVVARERVWCC